MPQAVRCHRLLDDATGCWMMSQAVRCHRLLDDATGCWMPQAVGWCHRLLDATGCWMMPQAVGWCHRLLDDATGCWMMPQAVGWCHRLLDDVTGCYRLLNAKAVWCMEEDTCSDSKVVLCGHRWLYAVGLHIAGCLMPQDVKYHRLLNTTGPYISHTIKYNRL